MRPQQLIAAVHYFAKDRLALIEGTCHVQVLPALSGEKKPPLRAARQVRMSLEGAYRILALDTCDQLFLQLLRRCCHHCEPMLEMRSSRICRVAYVCQRKLRMFSQMFCISPNALLQRQSTLR